MFRTIIEAIKKHRGDIDIALCKEQPEIWKALGLGMKERIKRDALKNLIKRDALKNLSLWLTSHCFK